MSYSVGQVADLAGVTVRTLHHYGQIGLLEPQDRSGAGYRRYSDDDLQRLQHILFYRELGFSLDDIATILSDPGANSGAHLRRQRELLTERISRLHRDGRGRRERIGGIHDGYPTDPGREVRDLRAELQRGLRDRGRAALGQHGRLGQSQARTAKFTKQQWIEIKEGR